MTKSRPVVLLALAALLLSCSKPQIHEAEYFVFGTLVQVSLSDVDDDQAAKVFSHIQARLQDMHSNWHAWEPGRLSEINLAFAAGKPITADPEIVELIRLSQSLEKDSSGLFNPAIGGLIELWGFHTSEYPVIGPRPKTAEINRWVSGKPSTRDIRISGDKLTSKNPHVQLDFGAVAKGYATDLICAELQEMGIPGAIINAGGDLRAYGSRGDRPWRIAIKNPAGGVLGGVEIAVDESVFTSGNYARFRESAETRYAHILDPRSGWPVDRIMSATVIADHGWLADAAATSLIVAGLEEWKELSKALQIDKILLTDEQGNVYLTPQMLQRLDLSAGVEPIVINQ